MQEPWNGSFPFLFPFVSGKSAIYTYVSVSSANFRLSTFASQPKRSFIIHLKIIRLNKGEWLIHSFPSLISVNCLAHLFSFLTQETRKLCIFQMKTRKSLGTPLSFRHRNQGKTIYTVAFVIKTVSISILTWEESENSMTLSVQFGIMNKKLLAQHFFSP